MRHIMFVLTAVLLLAACGNNGSAEEDQGKDTVDVVIGVNPVSTATMPPAIPTATQTAEVSASSLVMDGSSMCEGVALIDYPLSWLDDAGDSDDITSLIPYGEQEESVKIYCDVISRIAFEACPISLAQQSLADKQSLFDWGACHFGDMAANEPIQLIGFYEGDTGASKAWALLHTVGPDRVIEAFVLTTNLDGEPAIATLTMRALPEKFQEYLDEFYAILATLRSPI